jgi:hypothetical protein
LTGFSPKEAQVARIPPEELDRLKRETDLAALVRASGVELKRHGKDLIGLCPFHDDTEPSLVVTPSEGLWNCLGACGEGGTVVDWVMKTQGVSFRHAVEILWKSALAGGQTGVGSRETGDLPSAARPGRIVKASTVPKLPCPLDVEADDATLLDQVVGYYHQTLLASPEALAYLEKRGIADEEAIRRFRLGYANRTLGLRLPNKNRAAGAELRGRLAALGIYRGSGHEHLAGSVTIPVFDEGGKLAELYGRKVNDSLRKGTAYHLYLPGPHRGVWNLAALRSSKEVILCESLVDALSFWVHGFRNVTSAYGTNGFTDEMLQALKAYGVQTVLIAYDRDAAGDTAAGKLAKRLAAEGVGCFRVRFPKGMDANEYALKVQPAAKSLGLLVKKAEWMAGPTRRPGGRQMGVGSQETGEWYREAKDERGDQGVPGTDRLAEGNGPRAKGVRAGEEAAEGGAVRAELTDPESRDLDPGEHRGGPGEATPGGVCAAPLDRQGEPGGAGHAAAGGGEARLPGRGEPRGGLASDDRGASSPAGTHPEHPQQNGVVASDPSLATPDSRLPSARSAQAPDSRLQSPIPVKRVGDQVILSLGDREYRVRGLEKSLSYEQLKVMLRVVRGERFYLDTVDLVSARQRGHFVKGAARDLEMKESTVKRDLGRVHLKLEELQDAEIQKALAPEKPAGPAPMTEAERSAAMELLADPRLLERIVEDFDRCGVVGEETNKLTGYLAAISRKLERPLAVIIQSSSAAGKSALMEAVLAFVPPEERVKYSAMTGQSLFYMGEADLKHRILAIAEEEGAERAAYALKLLQSEGELTIASTGKDPASGRLVTHEYRVEGPVMIFLTTTAVDVDEELLNRCIVLTVDEDRDQTRAIHRLQRQAETLEGLLRRRDSERIRTLHRNAQRLLRPLLVANPFADRLTFLDDRTRTRRDHVKYLTLIRTIALVHQHQRPVKTTTHNGQRVEYVEVTPADIAAANGLAHEVLGRTLDELSPQTRRLLETVHRMVSERCSELEMAQEDYRFTRRDVRHHTGWTDFQVRTHLAKLADLEYVLVHHGGRGQSFVYELLYDGKGADGRPFLMRLLDVAELGHEYDGKNEHREADPEHLKPGNEPSSSPQRASVEHATRAAKEEENCCEDNDFEEVEPDAPRNAHQGPVPTQPSYPQSNRSVVGCQLSVLGPDHPPSNPLPASLPTTSNQQPTTNE